MYNMEEHVKTELTMAGGKKKSNGHKMSCMCPICKNMMKKKRGGAETEMTNTAQEDGPVDEMTVPDEEVTSTPMGGSRRRSRRSRRSRRKSRRSRRSRHSRRSRRH
jgi:hypothetical protein